MMFLGKNVPRFPTSPYLDQSLEIVDLSEAHILVTKMENFFKPCSDERRNGFKLFKTKTKQF